MQSSDVVGQMGKSIGNKIDGSNARKMAITMYMSMILSQGT